MFSNSARLWTKTASPTGPLCANPTTKSCEDSRTVAEDGPVLTAVEITTPGIRPSYWFKLSDNAANGFYCTDDLMLIIATVRKEWFINQIDLK
jgi:hypothetical protein